MLMEEYNLYTTSMPSLETNVVSDASVAGALGLGIAFVIITIIISIGAYVFVSICLSKIFKKAGITPWYAWVPFLNSWKILEMGDQKGAYIFFNLIPGVGQLIYAVFSLMAIYKINQKFGKDTGFFILALFLSPVWLAILAFDKSTWNGVSADQINVMPNPNPSYSQPTPQPVPAFSQPQDNNQYQQNNGFSQAPQQPQQPQQPSNDQQPPQSPTQYFN